MKKIAKIFLVMLFFSTIILFTNVKASSNIMVELGGETIGIKMNTGVYVVGKYKVKNNEGTIEPWSNSNIEIGDKIESINGIMVTKNQDILNYISKTTSDSVNLSLVRNNEKINTSINIVTNINNETSIGLYIRDQIQGIGTVTFKTSNNYLASLGHGIYDNKVLLEIEEGTIYSSKVDSIKKAIPGVAGEKRAIFNNECIGNIIKNDITGLYTSYNNTFDESKKIPLALVSDAKIGDAKIYTVVNGTKIESFDIEVIKINNQLEKSTKGLKIKVTDEDLINLTGGIVQGMSGSPIVQNGKLIGAVSHVTVDNPILGYGMYAEWMYEEIELIS